MEFYRSTERQLVMNQQAKQIAPADDKGAGPLVIITGFMGTGKSAVGQRLAANLGLPFCDTDQMICEMTDQTISELFDKEGEAHFRKLEEQVCADLASRRGLVVATGGGTLLSETNYNRFKEQGDIFLLEASLETISLRIGNSDTRPLLAGDKQEQIKQLLLQRQPLYHRLANRIKTDDKTINQIAALIASQLELPATTLAVNPPARPATSEILIGPGLLCRLGTLLRARDLDTTIFLLMAENVRPLLYDQISTSLGNAALPWREIAIADGDGEKNLAQAGHLLAELAANGAARDSVAVTIGGGVTGDLGGLVASIYMRGMRFVQVPTTLLAQVDASIGGKVGVNLPSAKNLVGNFYQPRLVVSDPSLLATLPDREISGGMAEVIKTAILGSPDLFAYLDRELTEGNRHILRDVDFLSRCVSDCAAIKAAVVERDPFEAGERRVLNLGHTVGHAFEAISSYQTISHGEAVSIGLVIASRIALTRGLIDLAFHSTIVRLLSVCGLPVAPPEFERQELLAALHLDKKKIAGKLHFILPIKPGCCAVVNDVTDEDVLTALHEEKA